MQLDSVSFWLVPIAAIVGLPVFNTWRERVLEKEFKRNEQFAAPDSEQLKWDIRHIREDINLLCNIAFIALILLAYMAFK